MMKIIIDARIIMPTPNGIGNYAIHLIQNLAKIDQRNTYYIIRREESDVFVVDQKNFIEVKAKYDITSAGSFFIAQPAINNIKADIYHSLFQAYPRGLRSNMRKLMTVHDLMWIENFDTLFYGSLYNKLKVLVHTTYGKTLMQKYIKQSKHLIAISQCTKERLIERITFDPSCIDVVYHGTSDLPESSPVNLPNGIRSYVLAVGNTRPQKNIPRLIEAFARLEKNTNFGLLIVGRGDLRKNLERMIVKLNLQHQVHFMHHVKGGQLRWLYENAAIFAFPSLVEGFGLPLLEAMRCRVPIITSNRPPMSEIVGDAGICVDPENIEAIKDGLQQVLQDSNVSNGLVQKGVQRASDFSWEKTARETLSVYEKMLKTVN